MLHQNLDDFRQPPLHARVQGLNCQVAGIGVHHQARKAVRLPVDQAVSVSFKHHPTPISQGPLKPVLPKFAIYGVISCGYQTQGDAGRGAVKGLPQEAAAGIGHRHQFARGEISAGPSRSLR